jgi:hypothetical protein
MVQSNFERKDGLMQSHPPVRLERVKGLGGQLYLPIPIPEVCRGREAGGELVASQRKTRISLAGDKKEPPQVDSPIK